MRHMEHGDYKKAPIEPDGEPEVLLTGRGALKMIMIAYKEERTAPGVTIIEELCMLLAVRRYGDGVSDIRRAIDRMPIKKSVEWINTIWDTYITTDDIFQLLPTKPMDLG